VRRLLLIALLVAPGWLEAQTRAVKPPPPAPAPDALDELIRDSPFLPAGGPTVPATEAGTLELRGVLIEDGHFLFSIYDQGSKESKWVRLGERGAPFVARSFDHQNDVLTVDYQGRSVALKLPPARVTGLALPGGPQGQNPAPLPSPQEAARPVQPQPPTAQAPAPSVPPNLKPEEAQRLQSMADEIRRRRQMQSQPPKK
jgi:hypothetical protein